MMQRPTRRRILAALLITGQIAVFTAPVAAENIAVPAGQQGRESVQHPPRGVNKTQVEAVFGEPLTKLGPVGEPPIYSWDYPNYTVYFEGDLVLHTVLKHQARKN